MECINNCFYCQHDFIYEGLAEDRAEYKRQSDRLRKNRKKAKERVHESWENRIFVKYQ